MWAAQSKHEDPIGAKVSHNKVSDTPHTSPSTVRGFGCTGRTNDTPRERCLLTLAGGRVHQWFLEYEENKNKESRGAEVGGKKNKSIFFASSALKALKKNYQREQVKQM